MTATKITEREIRSGYIKAKNVGNPKALHTQIIARARNPLARSTRPTPHDLQPAVEISSGFFAFKKQKKS